VLATGPLGVEDLIHGLIQTTKEISSGDLSGVNHGLPGPTRLDQSSFGLPDSNPVVANITNIMRWVESGTGLETVRASTAPMLRVAQWTGASDVIRTPSTLCSIEIRDAAGMMAAHTNKSPAELSLGGADGATMVYAATSRATCCGPNARPLAVRCPSIASVPAMVRSVAPCVASSLARAIIAGFPVR